MNTIIAVFQFKHPILKTSGIEIQNELNHFCIFKIDGDIEKCVQIDGDIEKCVQIDGDMEKCVLSIYLKNQNCLNIQYLRQFLRHKKGLDHFLKSSLFQTFEKLVRLIAPF